MADLAAVAAASTTATKTTAAKSATKGIADNFDQFLKLLTTQLKNQNPLEPLDTNQFTQQLVQFAGVEQQLKTNDTLSQLISSNGKSAALSAALGFVGANVTYDSSSTQLSAGKANWNLKSTQLGSATLEITNAAGNSVRSFANMTLNAGENPFQWNGRLENGTAAADGAYTLRVSAKNAKQEALTIDIESTGIVEQADVTGEVPMLKIGNTTIPVSAVKTIRRN